MNNPYAPPQLDARELTAEQPVGLTPELFARLQSTRIGLGLIYYGILVLFGGMIAAIVTTLVAVLNPVDTTWALRFVFATPVFVGAMMMFAGPFFCLTVPAESGARAYVVTAVVTQVLAVAAGMAGWLTGLWFAGGTLGAPISIFLGTVFLGTVFLGTVFLGTGGTCAFLLFMRTLAAFIHRHDLRRRADRALVAMIIFVLIWMAAMAGAVVGLGMSGIFFAVAAVVGLVAFVTFANVVNDVRKACRGEKVARSKANG